MRHREQDIGIFIDLFPLDKFYDNPVRRNLLILHSKWLNSLLASASDQVNLSRKGSLRRLAKDTLRTLQKPLAKAIGISRLTRRIDALGRHTAKADCHLVGDLVWCNGGRDFYPAEHFAAGVPGTFEGRTIQNPIGYHSYLQKLYGDYMQLRRRISGSCMALPAGIWMKQEKPNDQNCRYPLLFWQAAGELSPVCGKLSAQCYHRFLLFTDDTPTHLPENMHLHPTTFAALQRRVAGCFDFAITLHTPYKLCDYKPAYGEIFAPELSGYDFWGYGDMDLIFGDLRAYFTEDKLRKYDKFYAFGHLSLYRNTPENNAVYRQPVGMDYRKAFTTREIAVFDEINGISAKYKALGLPFYDRQDYADITKASDRLAITDVGITADNQLHPNYTEQIFTATAVGSFETLTATASG